MGLYLVVRNLDDEMKTIHTVDYKTLIDWLTSQRLLAGLTQAQLAERLQRPQSFVSKFENGERRLDVIESIQICKVLEIDPHAMIDILMKGN